MGLQISQKYIATQICNTSLVKYLLGVGSEFLIPCEYQFYGKDQQNTDGCGREGFNEKVGSVSKLPGFQQKKPGIVDKNQDGDVNQIRQSSSHAFNGRLFIVGISPFLGYQQVDNEWSYIRHQHTGSSVKTRKMTEGIKRHAQSKRNHHQPRTTDAKGEPENKYEIQIGCDHPVKMNLVEDKYLKQDKQ
jgi:hypothetical protein